MGESILGKYEGYLQRARKIEEFLSVQSRWGLIGKATLWRCAADNSKGTSGRRNCYPWSAKSLPGSETLWLGSKHGPWGSWQGN